VHLCSNAILNSLHIFVDIALDLHVEIVHKNGEGDLVIKDGFRTLGNVPRLVCHLGIL
jgi:hypothetical protein